jgi:hypothetical protein
MSFIVGRWRKDCAAIHSRKKFLDDPLPKRTNMLGCCIQKENQSGVVKIYDSSRRGHHWEVEKSR